MDTMLPTDDQTRLQQVRDIVAGYPAPGFLTGFDVKFDETWDGEPAIHVSYYAPMLYRPDSDELDQMDQLVAAISAHVRKIVPDRIPYIAFRAVPIAAR